MVTIYPPDLDGVKKEVRELKDGLHMSDKLGAQIKRGEKSWSYFVITYTVLLTLATGVISAIEVEWLYKIVLILVSAIFLFRLCFFNGWFRNKIVGIMSKSQEKVEEL